MNDRLAELKAGAAAPDDVAITIDGEGTVDGSFACSYFPLLVVTSFCVDNKPKQEKHMSEFFSAVDIVKQNIVVIRDSTKRIGDINQQVGLTHLSSTFPK